MTIFTPKQKTIAEVVAEQLYAAEVQYRTDMAEAENALFECTQATSKRATAEARAAASLRRVERLRADAQANPVALRVTISHKPQTDAQLAAAIAGASGSRI